MPTSSGRLLTHDLQRVWPDSLDHSVKAQSSHRMQCSVSWRLTVASTDDSYWRQVRSRSCLQSGVDAVQGLSCYHLVRPATHAFLDSANMLSRVSLQAHKLISFVVKVCSCQKCDRQNRGGKTLSLGSPGVEGSTLSTL